jgi:hypothetical protein
MHTNRLLTLLIFAAMLVVTACGSKSAATTQSSESDSAASPTEELAITTPVATAVALSEMSGKFDVNGRSLYIECLGTGTPTIVIETGERMTVWEFKRFQERLAEQTMTCVYDRAGNGRSDSVPTPRTAEEVVEDLHGLLAAAQVPGPYVLVGHSAGGLFVQLYGRKYPDQVAGVVAMNPVLTATPWLEEVGQVFTPELYAEEEAYYRGQNPENIDYMASSEEFEAAPAPPDVPFEMLISSDVECGDDEICLKVHPIYEQTIQEVTNSWPLGKLSKVDSHSWIFQYATDTVVEAVQRILASS